MEDIDSIFQVRQSYIVNPTLHFEFKTTGAFDHYHVILDFHDTSLIFYRESKFKFAFVNLLLMNPLVFIDHIY